MKRDEAEAMYPGIGAVIDAQLAREARTAAAIASSRSRGVLRKCRACGAERWWDNPCPRCMDPPELDNPPAPRAREEE
jgi:hypothetical protein